MYLDYIEAVINIVINNYKYIYSCLEYLSEYRNKIFKLVRDKFQNNIYIYYNDGYIIITLTMERLTLNNIFKIL